MTKQTNYSYSRLQTYKQCPFCYNLKYNQKKFLETPSLAIFVGSLVHYIEEHISLHLRDKGSPNYKELRELLYDINIPKKDKYDLDGDIYGINVLKNRFTSDFFALNPKTNLSYFSKLEDYALHLDRQEKFLCENKNLEIFDVEREFGFLYQGHFIKGYIDRILKVKDKNEYKIYDIKTKDRFFSKEETTTPLQHVIYSLGLQYQLNLSEPPTDCFYDLVFLREMQPAGTKGFIKRGEKQLDKIFGGISSENYPPRPSELCYYCVFSGTNPNIPEEGKFCCPYYSLWTPSNKTYQVMNSWEGEEKTEELVAKMRELDYAKKYGSFEF